MAALTQSQKLYLIQRLACFDSPSEIVHGAKTELGLIVTTQQVCYYDPTTVNGRNLAEDLKRLFEECRARFLADVNLIPIANQSYRLRRLQQMADDPMNRRNHRLVSDLLKQAAQEMGGLFTNKRELSGPNGGAIPVTMQSAMDQVYGDEIDDPAGSGNPV